MRHARADVGKDQPLAELERRQQWGRGLIVDTFLPQRSPRWIDIAEGVLVKLRAMGLDVDGEFALRENFGSGDLETLTRSALSAIENAGAIGVMTLPLNDLGPSSACPFVSNPYGWNPAMAVLDLDLVTEGGVRCINERGRQLRGETAGGKENSFDGIALRRFKLQMLAQEFQTVLEADHPDRDAVMQYIDNPPPEILDHVVTQLLSDRLRKPWQEWPEQYKLKSATEIVRDEADVRGEIRPLLYTQWKLDRQVKAYCNDVLKAGGYPIVVRPFHTLPGHSAVRMDWLRQRQGSNGAFKLNLDDGTPTHETGVNTGLLGKVEKYGSQRWGGAAYTAHPEAIGFVLDSIRPIAEVTDGRGGIVLDHWLGLFFRRCQFKVGDRNDQGEYLDAWGNELITAIRKTFPDLALFGEDVGFESPEVDVARKRFGTLGVDAPYFATQEGQPINWDHIHAHGVPKDKIRMVGADHNAEPPPEWFAGLPPDQRDALGRYYFPGWDQREEFHYWKFAQSVADCPHGLVTVAERDMHGDSRRDNLPGTPDSPENRLWQLTSTKTAEEEETIHRGSLADLTGCTRRRMQAVIEGLPLALSMMPKAGEVVRVASGETVTIRLGLTGRLDEKDASLVLESTLSGGGRLNADISYTYYRPDRLTVCEATAKIPADVRPGMYDLWGRIVDAAGLTLQNLCDIHQNVIIEVV
jgi:4-alpha-glucanotransferase